MVDNGGGHNSSDSETRQQVRAQGRALKRAAQEEENQRIIDEGRGTRAAKRTALANAKWFEAEHKRRPQEAAQAEGRGPVRSQSQREGSEPTRKRKMVGDKDKEPRQRPGKQRSRGNSSGSDNSDIDSIPPPHPKRRKRVVASSSSDSSEGEGTHDTRRNPSSRTSAQTSKGKHKSHKKRGRKHNTSSGESEASEDDHEPDEEDEDDDDDDLAALPDGELQALIGSEVPQVVGSQYQKGNSTTNGWQRSTREQRGRSSSPLSGPPTSDSVRTSSSHRRSQSSPATSRSTRHHSLSPTPQVKAGKNFSTAEQPRGRQQVFESERPQVVDSRSSDEDRYLSKKARRKKERAAPLLSAQSIHRPENTNDKAHHRDEKEWPPHAQLNGSNLKDQHPLIRELCRDAIKIVHITLLTSHAWPELNHLAEYRRKILNKAAKPLERNDDRYADIRERIKRDEKFAMVIGKLVMDRLAGARGPVRQKGLDHIAIFQLGVGDVCVERVQALLDRDFYIYPGKWGTNDKGKVVWAINQKEIYLNRAIIDILKSAFFATPTALGYKYQDHYKSSHPTRLEPELPASLVALAATGLYAGLHAWQTGAKQTNEKFEGDIFKSVFERHLEYLKSIKERNPLAYHVLMARIHSDVVGSNAAGSTDTNHQSGALGVVDLSEFV